MVMRGHRWTLCLLLQLILSRSARLDEYDRHDYQVVFGLEGQAVNLPPEARGPYAVVVAKRIEVDVGATLHITPAISGEVTWKYTPTCITKATDFVEVLRHSTFKSRAHVDHATGRLSVSDWSWHNDGFFTAIINGEDFAENYNVSSIVRVKPGDDLHLDPDLPDSVGHINRFSWYRDNTPVVEFNAAGGGVVYKFPHCLTNSSNCCFDIRTGKLTVKSWRSSNDGEFTMKVNGQLQKNGIKVVGDVTFVSLGKNMQLVPPPLGGIFKKITWRYGGIKIAHYDRDSDDLEYDTVVCNADNCIENCNFDKTTGKLTVKTLVHIRDQTFTLELDGRTLPDQYVVVRKLADYDASLEVEPSTERTSKLICAGDFDGAEPVTYLWRRSGTTGWVQGTKIMETKHVFVSTVRIGYVYDACKIQNPVSERVIEWKS